MASVLALLSKSFYESKVKIDGRAPEIGEVAPLDRYFSTNKRLQGLAEGGSLYLVTVRPPDEQLLLVAVLVDPVFEGKWWRSATPNRVKMTDIGELVDKLAFDNGKGISAAAGKLGMSLQTPRILCQEDLGLLTALTSPAGKKPARRTPAQPRVTKGKDEQPIDLSEQITALLAELEDQPDDLTLRGQAARWCAMGGQPGRSTELLANLIHLNAHETGVLPCLCKACMEPELDTATTGNLGFVREFAVAEGRVLYYWLPEQLSGDRARVSSDVAAKLQKRFGA